ncbi:hypothetical protein MKX01_009704 [Papaver californicum]|nr:hypothetical protein MKX01_009704 [Papaver californicum]
MLVEDGAHTMLRLLSGSVEEANGDFQKWSDRYVELSRATENQPTDLEDEQREDWMIAAAMAPNFGPTEDIEIGLRTHDVEHDWSEGLHHYASIDDDRRFTHILRQTPQQEHSTNGPDVSLTVLSHQQQAALDLVLHSMRACPTIRLIISGGAGTGKSTIINAIVRSTKELFGNDKVVRIMAPTGVAAFNIGGATIHISLP